MQPPCDVPLQEKISHQKDLPLQKKGKQGSYNNSYPLWYTITQN